VQESHSAVYVVSDCGGHDCSVHSDDGSDRDSEADVDIGGGEDLLCRRQRRGVAELADGIGLEVDGSGCENGGVCDHLALALGVQAKRVDANEFWRRFSQEYAPDEGRDSMNPDSIELS